MSFTRLLTLCFFLSLTACGFQPLYAPHNSRHNTSYPIKIAAIPNREGQILRNNLVDILTPEGAPSHPLYLLDITLTEAVISTGIKKDETTSRKEAKLTAKITLKDFCTNKVLYTHSTTAINSFSIIAENYYSDLTAQQYAKREAAGLLAEKIALLIKTYLNSCHED
ncbi:MAG: hypothetical protein ACD_16C00066G0011 [uncultured bacterium]|nr:MAG: hypothetical protein ACD_16C00066G0011 [uncultured bacterium]OFW68944.1 MAG: hypothetical protein A2X70_06935 [Alphaproteobacteria bacterium GWC2_42_16]OFW73778.1 MAG: hypothetical protein A2Z80_03160 [Alphaproteobacteria bacterium GWA2_41_27]OFW82039.1 MAG: hypothetical protein A3E50_01425 [Alphaproteobacteria bacterium RIFCSPHIGHO2_12_FULL_42_100]OFW85796.1 MAG: hypothetical protein A2W06_02805 [Alphaproteobacteria bacterium RBG_16_42_14]OFW91183.1 MAG: hypothetical protein A3C41_069